MRYVILGAGAVGGSIGGFLRLQGTEVVLLARGEHARVMKESGLTLATPAGTHHIAIEVASCPQELALRPDDILMLTTKTQQTEELLNEVAALRVTSRLGMTAGQSLPVACAQNGVENERIALRRFRRVYGICVMLPATHLRPGVVASQGTPRPGMLDVGGYPSGVDETAELVAADLAAAGFLSVPRAEIMRWKYAKLLRNLSNSIEALTASDDHDAAVELVKELTSRVTTEGREILAAAGIDVVDDEEWSAYRRDQVQAAEAGGQPRSGGSSWQSVSRGSGSIEADFLNGEIGLLARVHGIDSPVNDMLQQEANALARERRPPGSVAPADLLARLSS